MDSAIHRLRSAAQQLAHGKALRAIRYPAPFRAAVVRVARAHRERGRAVAELAHDLGLTAPTLTRWLEEPPAPRVRPVTIAPGALVEERAPARPVLITPQGVRVEGLDRAALIAVLRALA
jgi:transposase-like protein